MSISRRFVPRFAVLLALVGATGCQLMLTGMQDRETRHVRYTDPGIAASASGQRRAVDSDAALRRSRDLVNRPLSPEPGKRLRFLLWGLHAHRLYATDHPLTPELQQEAASWYEQARTLAQGPEDRGRNTMRSAALVRLGSGTETPQQVDKIYGVYLVETGRPGEALRLLEPLASSELPPDDHEFWNSLGLARLARGDLAGAQAAFDRQPGASSAGTAFQAQASETAVASASPSPMLDAIWPHSSPTLILGQLRRRFAALALPENHASGQVDREQLLGLWKQIERLAVDGLSKSYVSYLEGAKTFADAGEFEVAKGLLRMAARADKIDGHDPGAPLAQLCAAAYVASRAGDPAAASAAADCIERVSKKKRPLSARDKTAFAEAYTQAGRLDEAIALARTAIEDLEVERSSFAVDERAQFFRTAARRSYWALIRAHGLRAKQLAASSGPDAGVADLEAALIVTEQMRARQLGEILDERGRSLTEFARLDQLRERLGAEEALLSYVVTERDILVIAVDDRTWSFASMPIAGSALAGVTGEIARGLARPSTNAALLQEQLTLLGRALLRPAHAVVANARVLTVLPDGVLNTIPFDLLSVDAEWTPLLERTTVRLTPSLGFYLTPHRGRPVQDGFFALGDPIMPQGVPPLPETRTEIERIATMFEADKRRLLLGAEANESGFTAADISGYGAVHLATHGILGREIPGVTEPALIVSAEPGEDGFLTASEVAALSLNAEITVLSACKTGLGDMSSGEGVFGMSRAFLLAGSSSVVVSLWSVDSKATEELMVHFYDALRSSADPYEALREAKLRLRHGRAVDPSASTRGLELDDGKPDKPTTKRRPQPEPEPPPSQPNPWSHPYYWGAFSLVGR
ncbi:MAG TPA: CHAT domain-containing protein [Enhygromyxa sp.]|nr:CHAT domain-containing protein [Enhygromyxa sp.]